MPVLSDNPNFEPLDDHKKHLCMPCHTMWDPTSSHDLWNWPEWIHTAYIQGDLELVQTTVDGPIMIQVSSARKDLVDYLLQESSRTDKNCESSSGHERTTIAKDKRIADLLAAVTNRRAKTEVECSRTGTDKIHIQRATENDWEVIEDHEIRSRVAYNPTGPVDLWTLMSKL